MRAGQALSFPVEEPTPEAAASVTDRVWACVELQWEWLGGERGAHARPPANVSAHSA